MKDTNTNVRKSKPLASVSLDLDNLWSYMKIHGDTGWVQYPTYFDIFIPQVIDLLNCLNLKITFFVVGKDATIAENVPFLRMIAENGHEVGNHSFHHEPWLQKYAVEELEKEIFRAHELIARATRKEPVGFRGPGFSWSPELLEVLKDCEYLFDASTLPTYIGPLARMYYFSKSRLDKEQKMDRNKLFGEIKDGFRPIKPYLWRLKSGRTILELPVTTIPVVKIPFHLSYLLYLSQISFLLMLSYLKWALCMCKISGITPCFLIHPLDIIGADKLKALSFFPGMNISSKNKVAILVKVLKTLSKHFNIVNMSTHARQLLQNERLKTVQVT